MTEATCRHERGHIVDSRFFGDRFSTAASRRIFCDACRVQRWLTVEAELALAEAELGLIPAEAARLIAEAAHSGRVDLDAVKAETDRSGHSLVGLLRVLQAACEGDAGQYIHYGATTQDIQDTGQVLEMRDVLDELESMLREIAAHLLRIAEENAEVPALGRTHAQPALPMTFGLKVAGWLDETVRHLERLAQMRERVLMIQLFGGAGTMAAFGPVAPELLRRFGERLGLGVPAIGWHVARDRVAEFVTTLAMIAGTFGRAADEIRVLSRPEFGEVSEAWAFGKVGSSTMPHKRNPERCEQTVVMARLAAAQVQLAMTALGGDHERDSRSLRLEWACVADVSHYTLAGAQIFAGIISGLEVHPDRLWANVSQVADRIASEALMLALAERHGKQTAHEMVYQLTQSAQEKQVSVLEFLREQDDPGFSLDAGLLNDIFEPRQYLGASARLTRQVVADARAVLRRTTTPG
jgi:adenylosuccinate lyase